MGLSPRQVDVLSLWELNVAYAGYAESQGADVDSGLTDAEVEELARWVDS